MSRSSWCWKLILGKKCLVILIILLLVTISGSKHKKKRGKNKYYGKHRTTAKPNSFTKTICMQMDNTLRARRKTCFLRPDTGPCRADIIQWYFDVKDRKCYRFFWGGCQGNGNRFETARDCLGYCYLNISMTADQIPHFCSLAFDYGTCFGQYNRWGWDSLAKTCRRRLYSGCGGNQNNFESQAACLGTCLNVPNNTMQKTAQLTTCIPYVVNEWQ